MDDSPIEQLLSAVDRMDVDAAASLLAPDCRVLAIDGQRTEGVDEFREWLMELYTGLRSMAHKVISEWHQDDTWIAEVEGTYELRNWLRLDSLPRAVFIRRTEAGVADARFYGAHEQPMIEQDSDGQMMRLGGRWIPPL